jgi:acyl carrier protein
MTVTPADVRAFLLARYERPLGAKFGDPAGVPDDLDLHAAGVVDSFGVLELVGALEEQFDVTIDFDEAGTENLLAIGPLCGYVARKSAA